MHVRRKRIVESGKEAVKFISETLNLKCYSEHEVVGAAFNGGD
jgi:hypothetical protein